MGVIMVEDITIAIDKEFASVYLQVEYALTRYHETRNKLEDYQKQHTFQRLNDKRTKEHKHEQQLHDEWRKAADRYSTEKERLFSLLINRMRDLPDGTARAIASHGPMRK